MPGDDFDDQFDDLFKPFELGEAPHASSGDEPPLDADPEPFAPVPPVDETAERPITRDPITQEHVAVTSGGADAVSCPSCGATNPSFNNHCERCGSRLSHVPLPIAPAPAARATAGGRALGILAMVVLLVFLGSLVRNVFRGDADETTAAESETTTSTTIVVTPAVELFPTSVKASSQVADSFGPDNLLDGDPETYWNDDSKRGEGAWLEFTFAPPVEIRQIEIQNVTDPTKFRQNHKISGYTITVNDVVAPIPGRLPNSNEPHIVKVLSKETIQLRIDITSTYPAEPVGDKVPYKELALQAIRFFGTETGPG